MFRDMGKLAPHHEGPLEEATAVYLRDAMPRGDYLAWVAEDEAATIVGGAGVHLRPILPRADTLAALEFGPEALIVNVYVEPAWRRRGAARALMVAILDALGARGISRVLLHASEEGRSLYESLGFTATNEMRLRLG
jgi:GNAT superfamily N-acetyltransferase